METNREIAVFGGGCFWCTEAVFQSLKGVISVTPGYSGGSIAYPTYEQVSSGTTGHAEVTRIEYDSTRVSYHDLLTVFFATHDPTTLNRQGNDVGTQYRSAIFYTNDEQKQTAEVFIKELNESDPGGHPVVTEVTPFEVFYEAEEYHRNYFLNNPDKAYCQIVINPKVQKVQKKFAELLKENEEK